MNIKEWLTGTEQEKAAKKEISTLLEKEKLSVRDRSALDFLQKKTKALAMRQIGAALIALAGVAIPLSVKHCSEQSEQDKMKKKTALHSYGIDESKIPEVYMTLDQALGVYKQSLEEALSLSQEDAKYLTAKEQEMVKRIQDAYRNKVTWMHVSGNDYVAAETAKWKGSGIAIIPEGHRLMTQNKEAFVQHREPGSGMQVIQVKPVAISKAWAGIILGHELVHLDDRTSGRESHPPKAHEYLQGEVRAFDFERTLAKKMSQGKFTPAVQGLIEKYQLRSFQDYINIFRNFKKYGDDINLTLSMAFGGVSPSSQSEQALRNAFYLVSIGFQVIENTVPPDQQETEKVKFMSILYEDQIPKN